MMKDLEVQIHHDSEPDDISEALPILPAILYQTASIHLHFSQVALCLGFLLHYHLQSSFG